MKCELCDNTATNRVALTSRSSGRVLMEKLVCPVHLAQEQTLQTTGLSMVGLLVSPLAVTP